MSQIKRMVMECLVWKIKRFLLIIFVKFYLTNFVTHKNYHNKYAILENFKFDLQSIYKIIFDK